MLYEYDDDGNRTRVDEDNGSTSADYRYCYDALDQLIARKTASACTSSPTETATYDDAGNRTQWVSGGSTRNRGRWFADGPDGEGGAGARVPSPWSGSGEADVAEDAVLADDTREG